MPVTNGIFTAPVDLGRDIGGFFGFGSSYDLGYMIQNAPINPMAVFKPIKHTGLSITDAQRATAKYGLSIPETSNPSNLIRSNYTWRYNKPIGSSYPYRALDFVSSDSPTAYGYYQSAPGNILCCPRTSSSSDAININPINELAPVVNPCFYAFSKNSSNNGIFDKQLDTTYGISGTSYNHSATELACSLGIEDISTTSGSLFTGSYRMLGLALFTGNTASTYQQFVPCQDYLSNGNATLNRDMVMIGTSTILSIPTGNYKAVGCLRVGNPIVPIGEEPVFSYIPLHAYNWDGSDSKKNQFNLNIGGVSNYSVSVVGIADTESGTPSGVCTDSDGVVYLFIDVTNNQDINHRTTPFSFDRWAEHVHVVGSYVDSNGNTVNVDKTLIESINKVNGTTVTSTKIFNIAAGATARMVFAVGPLWGSTMERLRSGQVDLTAQLKFDTENFSQSGSMLLRVNYSGQLIA